jgi:tetratricopeptide (TPR) repeat protein
MGAIPDTFEEMIERCRMSLQDQPKDELIAMTFSSLEMLCKQNGEWDKLVKLLDVRLSLEKMPHVRQELFGELMRIYEEELDQKEMSFLTACRALKENMEDEALRLKLEQFAEETDSVEEMAMVYEEILDGRVACTEAGLALVRRLAKIKEFQLEEPDEAISLWQQVLWAEPDDEEAFSSLERLLRAQGDFTELVRVLESCFNASRDSDRRLWLLRSLKDIYTHQIMEPVLAFGTVSRAVKEKPEDETLRRQLELMAEQQDMFEEAMGVYLDVADDLDGTELAAGLRRRADWIRKKHLTGHAEEINALTSLADLYRDRGEYADLVEILRRQAKLERCSERKIDIYYEVAQIAEERLNRRQVAIEAYLEILAEDKQERAAAKLLNRLYMTDTLALASSAA